MTEKELRTMLPLPGPFRSELAEAMDNLASLEAELERLQRIEAAARDRQAAMDAVRNRGGQKNSDWLVRAEAALRAALATDGAET